MKVPMDARNHGAGTNSNGACSINEPSSVNLSCRCYGVNVENCWIKLFNKKMNQKNKIINLIVVMILIITTTGFKYIDKFDEDTTRMYISNENINKLETVDINPQDKINIDEYKEVMKEFRDFMLENHILFDNVSREEFKLECNSFIKNAKVKSLLDMQYDMKLLMSKLGQGHVQIVSNYENSYSNIILEKFRDGYYVFAGSQNDIIGSQVLEINGIDIDEVIKHISKYVSAENESFRNKVACQNIIMMNLLRKENIAKDNNIKLTLKKDNNKYYYTVKSSDFKKIKVNKIEINNKNFFTFNIGEFYFNNLKDEFKKIKPIPINKPKNKLYYNEIKNNSLIVHYDSALENENSSIYELEKDFNEKLISKNPKCIVIDLRLNGGGSDYLFENIIMKIMQYQSKNRNVKIKLLIGRNSYSAAGDNALSILKVLDNVEIIGEDSGFPVRMASGALNLFYVKRFQVLGTYCPKVFSNDYMLSDVYNHNYNNYDYIHNTMTPDFYAEQSFADYMIGNDPAMNYALRDEGNNSLIDRIKDIFN
ncbi:MAG: hypothetical protein KH152_02555 [Finegoldia magna]|nr:hypothetical protein [Finegoldia magna]